LKFNVIRPGGEHAGIFFEMAELIQYSIRELGYECIISISEIVSGHKNIVMGIHHSEELLDSLPENSIIINTEPLFSAHPSSNEWSSKLLKYGARYKLWDYNSKNIETLRMHGFENVMLFKFGYQKELDRIPQVPDTERTIDVLFYGSYSLRRNEVLNRINSAGLKLHHSFGVYGTKRDELISQSKIVLNVHSDESGVFEIVRAHYLFNNGVALISEVNSTTNIEPFYSKCLISSSYDQLTVNCKALINNSDELFALRERTKAQFSLNPQVHYIAELLSVEM
jgi:hypothetical protein